MKCPRCDGKGSWLNTHELPGYTTIQYCGRCEGRGSLPDKIRVTGFMRVLGVAPVIPHPHPGKVVFELSNGQERYLDEAPFDEMLAQLESEGLDVSDWKALV